MSAHPPASEQGGYFPQRMVDRLPYEGEFQIGPESELAEGYLDGRFAVHIHTWVRTNGREDGCGEGPAVCCQMVGLLPGLKNWTRVLVRNQPWPIGGAGLVCTVCLDRREKSVLVRIPQFVEDVQGVASGGIFIAPVTRLQPLDDCDIARGGSVEHGRCMPLEPTGLVSDRESGFAYEWFVTPVLDELPDSLVEADLRLWANSPKRTPHSGGGSSFTTARKMYRSCSAWNSPE